MEGLEELKGTLQRHDDELVAAVRTVKLPLTDPHWRQLENEIAGLVQRIRQVNQAALEWIYRTEAER